jgi:hypothetical protein
MAEPMTITGERAMSAIFKFVDGEEQTEQAAGAGRACSGEEADPIRLELALRRSEGEALIRKRLDRAKREGDLPPHANPADVARYLAAVYQGMSVQAAGGATREQLRRVAEIALRAWPK